MNRLEQHTSKRLDLHRGDSIAFVVRWRRVRWLALEREILGLERELMDLRREGVPSGRERLQLASLVKIFERFERPRNAQEKP